MNLKTYLGDGVYAESDGFGIRLTTEELIEGNVRILNAIVLEPEIIDGLNAFWSKVQERKSSCETVQANT